MSDVFKALADRHRRRLLDRLRDQDGQTLSELCTSIDMSRQAVSKHLNILEAANLVITRQEGRTKLHYLNAVPLQEIVNRWVSRFASHQAVALTGLRHHLEKKS